MTMKKPQSIQEQAYARFAEIDGSHPYRAAAPQGFVDYPARTRHHGRVFYLNFELAREMGLLPTDHPDRLTPALSRAVLDAFSLQIINEYDMLHKVRIPVADRRPNAYMATRYLQLQHPDKSGLTSGDGRSIWNGCFSARGKTWDISSCGTGATRLSPATAIEKRYFRTGDKKVSYGGGRSDLDDGVAAAMLSEIFHRNAITTERTLAVIAFPDRTSINVRAAPSLLRPAHFFGWLKQNDYANLKGLTDFYIARQIGNKAWPKMSPPAGYDYFLRQSARDFARAAARFEMEYIFCWMDWDGDNILSNGGIIDYGSIRQFGLFHYEYRYDDYDRMSTNIIEQRRKARHIVKTVAQLTGYVKTGRKRPKNTYAKHPALALFDREFALHKREILLYKIGFNERQIVTLMRDANTQSALTEFQTTFTYFERAKSKRGPYEVSDGITWDAIFCVRDILRELPQRILQTGAELTPEQFMEIILSDYAKGSDRKPNKTRIRHIRNFQAQYGRLLVAAARRLGLAEGRLLKNIARRSALINRYERMTGDAVIHVTSKLMEYARNNSFADVYAIFMEFVDAQVLRPEYFTANARQAAHRVRRPEYLHSMLEIVREHRDGI